MNIQALNQNLADIQEKIDSQNPGEIYLLERRKGYLSALRDIMTGKVSVTSAGVPQEENPEKTPHGEVSSSEEKE